MSERLLINYLPDVIKKIREYKLLTAAEQPGIDDLWREVVSVLDNQFFDTMTEYGISRWEKILAIVPKATQTQEERRFDVTARLAEQLPYTYRRLSTILTELCGESGYVLHLDITRYTLSVRLALTVSDNISSVESMLRRIAPANMAVDVMPDFNKHQDLRRFTHQELRQYTHYRLRNEVL